MPSRSVVTGSAFQPSRRSLLATAVAGAALTGVTGLAGAAPARGAQAKKAELS